MSRARKTDRFCKGKQKSMTKETYIKMLMKLPIAALVIGLQTTALSSTSLGYSPGIPVKDLVAKGYRWVTVNGPYACVTEQNVRQITSDHTDVRELPKGPRSQPRGLSLESKGAESAVQPSLNTLPKGGARLSRRP